MSKAKARLAWPGASHDVLEDLNGFYVQDFLSLGLNQGDLDTDKDLLADAKGLDYLPALV